MSSSLIWCSWQLSRSYLLGGMKTGCTLQPGLWFEPCRVDGGIVDGSGPTVEKTSLSSSKLDKILALPPLLELYGLVLLP